MWPRGPSNYPFFCALSVRDKVVDPPALTLGGLNEELKRQHRQSDSCWNLAACVSTSGRSHSHFQLASMFVCWLEYNADHLYQTHRR